MASPQKMGGAHKSGEGSGQPTVPVGATEVWLILVVMGILLSLSTGVWLCQPYFQSLCEGPWFLKVDKPFLTSDLRLLLLAPFRGDGPRVPCGLGATVDPKVAHQFTEGLPPPALCASPDISHEHQAPLRALEPSPAFLEEARLQLQCAQMPHPTPTHLIHGLYGARKLQLFNYFKHPPYTPFQ